MIYTVFSTSNSPYMQWQSELLEYSWKQVGQEGELIRLLANDGARAIPAHHYAKTVQTQSWRIHPFTGDDFAPYNKPASLLEWLHDEQPEGTVLFIDPDCVFREPINREVSEGHAASQTWIDLHLDPRRGPFGLDSRFTFLTRLCANTSLALQPVMIPTLIHTSDLKRLAPRWLELISLIRQTVRDAQGNPLWESDMFAYLIAAAEYRVDHEPGHFGICTNWPVERVGHAPIIHYCQAIESNEGVPMWSKGTYRPWQPCPSPHRARQDYGRDLLTLLNSFIHSRRLPDQSDSVMPQRRNGIQEGRVLDKLLLFNADGTPAIGLDAAYARVWELCDGDHTVEEISAICEERGVAEGAVPGNVMPLLRKFNEAGLLDLHATLQVV